MAFVNKQSITVTLGPAVSTQTVGVAAFTLGRIVVMSVTARASSTATNNWDSQCTAEPLPGTNQIRVTRAGNTGTLVVEIVFVEDDTANTQHFKSTTLVAGANNFATSAVTLANTWAQSLGMKEPGNRDDQSTATVIQTTATNLQLFCTVTPSGGHEINALVVEYPGATIQTVLNTTNTPVTTAISSVDTMRAFTFASSRCVSSAIWRNDEIDTYDLQSATQFRTFRYLASGLLVVRHGYIIELPTSANVSVQRGRTAITGATLLNDFPVSAVDPNRSAAKGLGGPLGHYNFAEATGTNANQERATFAVSQTSSSNVRVQRSVAGSAATIGFELLTWGLNGGGGARKGTLRRLRNGISRRAMIGAAA